jgi:hypothetical protein
MKAKNSSPKLQEINNNLNASDIAELLNKMLYEMDFPIEGSFLNLFNKNAPELTKSWWVFFSYICCLRIIWFIRSEWVDKLKDTDEEANIIEDMGKVMKSMKTTKGSRTPLDSKRNEYRNFLYSCLCRLPSIGSFKHCLQLYAPAGKTNKEITNLLSEKIQQFLYREFSDDIIQKLDKESYINQRGKSSTTVVLGFCIYLFNKISRTNFLEAFIRVKLPMLPENRKPQKHWYKRKRW